MSSGQSSSGRRLLRNGMSIRSQHVTPRRSRVGRIEHQAVIRRPAPFIFPEVREVELAPRQRDTVRHMTVRINKMWVSVEGLFHQTPGDEGAVSLVCQVHLERQKPREGSRSWRSLPPSLLEVPSQPPPTIEVLERAEAGHSPCSVRSDCSRGILDGISTTALGVFALWVPPALTREDNLGAIRRFGEGFAIVVIPHPGGVVRIPEHLVTGEEEGVWHLALDSRIGGLLVLDSCFGRPYGATERQREQQCGRHHQRSRHGQQPPWPRSPLRCPL